MQKRETSKNKRAGDISQMLTEQLLNDKFVKGTLYIGVGVFGLFALGFVFKAINYTAHNFKNLNATLKR